MKFLSIAYTLISIRTIMITIMIMIMMMIIWGKSKRILLLFHRSL